MLPMNTAISRVVVLDQHLPEVLPVQRVEVRRITLEPHTALGPHVHNGPVFGNILSGSAVYQQSPDSEPQVLRAGDVFYEPAADRIERFDTETEPVTFIAYFPLTSGQDATLDLVSP
jgi:quercetin dioxygenase-like cupin family protein